MKAGECRFQPWVGARQPYFPSALSGVQWDNRLACVAYRRLLAAEKGPGCSSGAQLQQRLGRLVCGRVLASLPAVLNRARMLAPGEQVAAQGVDCERCVCHTWLLVRC